MFRHTASLHVYQARKSSDIDTKRGNAWYIVRGVRLLAEREREKESERERERERDTQTV